MFTTIMVVECVCHSNSRQALCVVTLPVTACLDRRATTYMHNYIEMIDINLNKIMYACIHVTAFIYNNSDVRIYNRTSMQSRDIVFIYRPL